MLSEVERRFCRLDGPWRLTYRRKGDQHVYPPGDDILHKLDGNACPCGPSAVLLDTACEHTHFQYSHRALDGREGCDQQ